MEQKEFKVDYMDFNGEVNELYFKTLYNAIKYIEDNNLFSSIEFLNKPLNK